MNELKMKGQEVKTVKKMSVEELNKFMVKFGFTLTDEKLIYHHVCINSNVDMTDVDRTEYNIMVRIMDRSWKDGHAVGYEIELDNGYEDMSDILKNENVCVICKCNLRSVSFNENTVDVECVNGHTYSTTNKEGYKDEKDNSSNHIDGIKSLVNDAVNIEDYSVAIGLIQVLRDDA